MVRPRVQMVRQGSVGEKTGLMPGDIVTHVDGTPVSTHLEATRLIQTAETGVVLSITRGVGSSQSKSGASPRRSPSARMASLLRRNSSKSPRSAASAAPTVAEQAVREDPSASLFEDSTTCRSRSPSSSRSRSPSPNRSPSPSRSPNPDPNQVVLRTPTPLQLRRARGALLADALGSPQP